MRECVNAGIRGIGYGYAEPYNGSYAPTWRSAGNLLTLRFSGYDRVSKPCVGMTVTCAVAMCSLYAESPDGYRMRSKSYTSVPVC